jgi:hypothetical protein
MTKHRLARGFATLGLGLSLAAAPAVAGAAPTKDVAAQTEAPAKKANVISTTSGARSREASYAERQEQNPRTAAFKGNGAGIYIGGSTLAVVLVVVLVVVLL